MKPLVFLELNEVNLDYVKAYVANGELPSFASILKNHGLTETTSECKYEDIEPWIQWVTVHTGLSFDEHRVFRLGDFVATDLRQVWEQLEGRGLKVGAVCPMNASNRLKRPSFFMPDPWTDADTSGSWLFRELANAISQTVNDNTEGRVTARSGLILLLSALRYAYASQYRQYLRDGIAARGRPWRRAIVLDRLISNVFERQWSRYRPDFASLFLNGTAFVQHHYLFSSSVYEGPHTNPKWYVPAGEDPVIEAYRLYDDILGRVMSLGTRVMIATGLHQIPYGQTTYYWRLRNHEKTLRSWKISFTKVQRRMSRDFLVVCGDKAEAAEAASILGGIKAQDGQLMFEVDQRGNDLFVMLIYPHDISKGFSVRVGAHVYENFDREVAFVAIKNGHHHGNGYFIDTGEHASQRPASVPLKEIKNRVTTATGFAQQTADTSMVDDEGY